MTRKIYKSAMGKPVDLGALLLQNEQVRAVGNMGVNAAGDLVDSADRVIDQRNRQVQRQYRRQTNVSNTPVATSNRAAKKNQADSTATQKSEEFDNPAELSINQSTAAMVAIEPVTDPAIPSSGGLAAAMARSREVKQELEKTRRQQMQEQGIKKI
jgi:hypothetical protein